MVTETLVVENTLERAIELETPVSFVYDRGENTSRRTVSPYELREGKNGKTLLVCWSHPAESVRMFDTERITALRSEEGAEEFVPAVER